MVLINITQYEEITGQNFGNTKTSAKFNAVAQLIQDTVIEPALPPTMWTVLQTGTQGAELQAFLDEYILRMLAYGMLDYITTNPAQTTNIGTRIMNTQTSNAASDAQVGVASQVQAKATDQYRERMYNRYLVVSYVFDGTDYPPVPAMKKFWQNHWYGLAYGTGAYGWGWYGNGTWLPPYGGGTVSANGIQVIPIKAGW